MIDAKQSRQKQRVVIEFLLLEGKTALNISRRPKQVYSGNVVDYSTVTRRVKRINNGQEEPEPVRNLICKAQFCLSVCLF